MISFQAFRQTDGTPIYLQIIRYIQQGLAAGTIQDGAVHGSPLPLRHYDSTPARRWQAAGA